MKYYSAHERSTSVICYHMDELREYYAKLNKPATEGQKLHNST